MSKFLNYQYPPPNNWQEFENLAADLWAKIWDDPNTQKNGRTGQPQCGVDVFGQRGGQGDYHGVQCKGKDTIFGKGVTEKELRDEVEKAKNFIPKLETFTLATTAQCDQKIQKIAIVITVENQKSGLFSVSVFGWDEIHRRLAKYSELIDKYYPGQGSVQHEMLKNIETVIEKQDSEAKSTSSLHRDIKSIKKALTAIGVLPSSTDESTDPEDIALNKEIDAYREHIKSRPLIALQFFEDLKSRCWDEASEYIKFRITTNIGASHFNMGNDNEAAKYFMDAVKYAPENYKAINNLALANIILGDLENANLIAKQALDLNSENYQGYSLLIVSHEFHEEPIIIESIVPPEVAKNPEVSFAIGHAYRKRGMTKDAFKWFGIAYENDKESREIRVAYSTEILSKLFEHESISHGQQLDLHQESDLRNSIEIMESVWAEIVGTELEQTHFPMILNMCNAYRVLGDELSAKRY